MKAKQDEEILANATNTIIRWYEETRITITTALKPIKTLDVELLGILLAARKHTLGALTTLTNEHIIPTHALLRVLCEIHIVLLWAMNAPTKKNENKSDAVYSRLRSWDHSRLIKHKNLLENLPETAETKKSIKKIEGNISESKKQGIKSMPSVKQIFDELGQAWAEVYPKFYQFYCRSIHLDRNITQELAHLDRGSNHILYKNDIEPRGNELLHIASISCDINKMVRNFYDWHVDLIQKEYENLQSMLGKR